MIREINMCVSFSYVCKMFCDLVFKFIPMEKHLQMCNFWRNKRWYCRAKKFQLGVSLCLCNWMIYCEFPIRARVLHFSKFHLNQYQHQWDVDLLVATDSSNVLLRCPQILDPLISDQLRHAITILTSSVDMHSENIVSISNKFDYSHCLPKATFYR